MVLLQQLLFSYAFDCFDALVAQELPIHFVYDFLRGLRSRDGPRYFYVLELLVHGAESSAEKQITAY
eukprot:scaffold11897_cov59-Cylindrotheca_fusiformis.AAC.1